MKSIDEDALNELVQTRVGAASLQTLINTIKSSEIALLKIREQISTYEANFKAPNLRHSIDLNSLRKSEMELVEISSRAATTLKNFQPKTPREHSDQANAIADYLLRGLA